MKKILLGIAYWVCQLTWGILMNIVGIFVTIFCLIFLKGKMHKNGYGFITEVGGNWGGVSLGAFALCGKYKQEGSMWFYEEVRRHEFGHSIQNMFLGPLFPFIVAIPSAIRYWYYTIETGKGKTFSDDWYDSVWFEGTATQWGTTWIDWIEEDD